MKKKLLVATVGAALAVPAMVFADYGNFNISGRIRAGISYTKLYGDKPAAVGDAQFHDRVGVDDNLSGFVFAGKEDLSDSTSAFFSVETRFSPDIGTGSVITGLAYGNTGVGFQGPFGKLTLGRWDLHYVELFAIEGLRAGSIASHAGAGPMSQVANPLGANGTGTAVYIANGRRTDNLLMWDSPSWAGITTRLAVSPNASAAEGANASGTYSSTDPGKDFAYNVALRYNGKGITAGVSIWKSKAEGDPVAELSNNSVGDQKSMRAWAGYTAKFGLKAGLGYDVSYYRFTADQAYTHRNAVELPISFTTGAHTPYLTIAKVNRTKGGADNQDNSLTGARELTAGYDYAVGKRTTLGFSYNIIKNESRAGYNGYGPHVVTFLAGSGATQGADVKSIFLGVQHVF
jgi:predicted porin